MSLVIGLALIAASSGSAAPAARGPNLSGMPPVAVRMADRRRSRPDLTAPSKAMRMRSHAIMMPWDDMPMPRDTAPPRPAPAGSAPRRP